MAMLAHIVEGEEVDHFDIGEEGFTLGRLENNYIQISDDTVSGVHALISIDLNSYCRNRKEFYLEDLNSTNGTFVNQEKVSGAVRLRHNDLVRVAWCDFKFIDDSVVSQDNPSLFLPSDGSPDTNATFHTKPAQEALMS